MNDKDKNLVSVLEELNIVGLWNFERHDPFNEQLTFTSLNG